ncbi:STAS domain-containing protein, partial [Magnetospirillum fulvum]
MSLDEDTVTIACSGELTLPRAEELRDSFLSALGQSRSVVIDVTEASEIDLSFIQLILAARTSVERRGGSLRLVSPADGVLASTLRAAGLTGGPFSPDSQLWIEG